MQAEYFTTSPGQTKKLAENLAKEILQQRPKARAVVIALSGELGSGKTTFLQGFAKGLGIKQRILSPTFVLMKRFAPLEVNGAGKKNKTHKPLTGFGNFYHIDCYRVAEPKEILALGFKEIIANPQNIIAIEWADRIKSILPKDCLIIKFELLSKGKRCVKVSSL